MTETLLTPKEVARELRVTDVTMYRWLRDKRLRSVRLPGGQLRVPESELVRLLAGDQLERIRQHVPPAGLGDGRMKIAPGGKLFLARDDGAVITLDGDGASVSHPDGTVSAFVDRRQVFSGPGATAA